MKLIAAMSGGVDSAVAAARAVEAGHEVIGVHLALSSNPQKYRSGARGCCTIEDSHDARRAADVIGIPFYIWDMAEEFHDGVVENFLSEYSEGRTPNPCLRCNEKIKFAAVLDRAKGLGFDGVITGHYAQMRETEVGRMMFRAIDPTKDQSYVLAVLNTEQLAGAHFPLGDTIKDDVRIEAKRRGLYVANQIATIFVLCHPEIMQVGCVIDWVVKLVQSLMKMAPNLANTKVHTPTQSGNAADLV
jgi:tRNA-uridine 2-sulfurtransferase